MRKPMRSHGLRNIISDYLGFVNIFINTYGGGAQYCMPREWNTPIREPWNAPIHNTLKAIDNHTQEYFKSGDIWHLQKADQLRQYLHELKTWIHRQEGR
jgi:hypothetical protein